MSKTYELRPEEGQMLLFFAHARALPARLGEDSFDDPTRAMAAHEVTSLRLALRKVSPAYHGRDSRIIFGSAENYTIKDNGNGVVWKELDVLTPVQLNSDAIDGAYWCLLLMAHPSSPYPAQPFEVADLVFPLADKLRLRKQLERDIHLADRKGKKIELDEEVETGPKLVEKEGI